MQVASGMRSTAWPLRRLFLSWWSCCRRVRASVVRHRSPGGWVDPGRIRRICFSSPSSTGFQARRQRWAVVRSAGSLCGGGTPGVGSVRCQGCRSVAPCRWLRGGRSKVPPIRTGGSLRTDHRSAGAAHPSGAGSHDATPFSPTVIDGRACQRNPAWCLPPGCRSTSGRFGRHSCAAPRVALWRRPRPVPLLWRST